MRSGSFVCRYKAFINLFSISEQTTFIINISYSEKVLNSHLDTCPFLNNAVSPGISNVHNTTRNAKLLQQHIDDVLKSFLISIFDNGRDVRAGQWCAAYCLCS